MPVETHPLAPHHLPKFIGGADGSDPLFTVVLILLVVILMVIGNYYFKLHAVPERMAHKHNNTQLQFITILTILALFTHNNVFWVAALLLAVIRLPDLSTPINSIAASLAQLASAKVEQEAIPPMTSTQDEPQASPPIPGSADVNEKEA